MDLTGPALTDALRGILPAHTGLGYAALTDTADPCPDPDIGPATPARLREFAAGRRALRRAMQAIGLTARPVPRAPDRGPLWPDGVVGAITHAGPHALAIVADGGRYGGLGLDLVAPADRPEPALWPLFLHPHEYAGADQPEATARLAAKESAIKLLRDATGVTPGFLDLSVTLGPPAGVFSIAVGAAAGAGQGTVHGYVLEVAGHTIALCATPPHRPARPDKSTAS